MRQSIGVYKFPIIFGDNDSSLQENKGKLTTYTTKDAIGTTTCRFVIPEFAGIQCRVNTPIGMILHEKMV